MKFTVDNISTVYSDIIGTLTDIGLVFETIIFALKSISAIFESFDVFSGTPVVATISAVVIALDIVGKALTKLKLDFQLKLSAQVTACERQALKTIDIVPNNQMLLKFLTCPYNEVQKLNTSFQGAGCDGIDNDCDSIFNFTTSRIELRSVDECDEDKVPPTIQLTRDPPKFKSEAEAREWILANTITSDDCKVDLRKQIISATPSENDGSLWEFLLRVWQVYGILFANLKTKESLNRFRPSVKSQLMQSARS